MPSRSFAANDLMFSGSVPPLAWKRSGLPRHSDWTQCITPHMTSRLGFKTALITTPIRLPGIPLLTSFSILPPVPDDLTAYCLRSHLFGSCGWRKMSFTVVRR